MQKKVFIILSILIAWQWADAQYPLLCKDSLHCSTGIIGAQKTKGIEFNYERSSPFDAEMDSPLPTVGHKEGSISRYRRLKAKIKLPICSVPGLKLGFGFSYKQEYFRFSSYGSTSDAFRGLDHKQLKQAGVQFYALKPFRGNMYLGGRLSAATSGDFKGLGLGNGPKGLILTGSMILVHRPDIRREQGVGFAYSYALGRPRLYPLLMYNRSINENWGLEALLPARVAIRRNMGGKAFFYSQVKVDGAAYHVRLPGQAWEGRERLEFRRSELRAGIEYHHELFDPLWLVFSTGYRHNLSITVNEPGRARSAPLARGKLGDAVYFDMGIYLVPPKKMYEKAKACK